MDIKLSEALVSNFKLVIHYKDANGELAEVDGPQMVTSSDPSVAVVLSQDDSKKEKEVIYQLMGVLGKATLSGFADAAFGEAENLISWGPFELNVVADPLPEAVSAEVAISELIPK